MKFSGSLRSRKMNTTIIWEFFLKVCRDCNISFSPLSFLSLLSARSPEEYLSFDRTLAKVESSRIYHFSILSTRHKKISLEEEQKLTCKNYSFWPSVPWEYWVKALFWSKNFSWKRNFFWHTATNNSFWFLTWITWFYNS